MNFGRQNNMRRRAVRPDGRVTRDMRRRRAGRDATLLDLVKAGPQPPGRLERLAAFVRRLLGR